MIFSVGTTFLVITCFILIKLVIINNNNNLSGFFFNLCVQNNSLCGFSGSLRQSQRRLSVPSVVVSAAASSNGGEGERKSTVLVENSLKEMRDTAAPVIAEPTVVSGGVEDVYGEDSATEDQSVTPWSVSVARYSKYTYNTCVCFL